MDLKLLSMKYENIREFKDVYISFVKDKNQLNPYHISLIQMPNGTGKTTTMNLLNSAISGHLFGDAKSYSPKDYCPDFGFFELCMLLDGEYYVIKIDLNYIDNTYSYWTSKPSLTKGGMQEGHNLPADIKHIVSKEFTELFIFNGELSERLLDHKDSSAKKAIEVIYFLDKLLILNNRIDAIVENEQEKSISKVTKEQGLKQQQTMLNKFRNIRSNLESRKNQVYSVKNSKSNKLTALISEKEKLFSDYESINERRIMINRKLDELKQTISSDSNKFLRSINLPGQYSSFFNTELKLLADSMVKLKLPKSTSSEFFRELADSDKCICGEIIDKKRREAILINSQKYLSEENTSVMNSIKNSIREIGEYNSQSHIFEDIFRNESESRELYQELDVLMLNFSKANQAKAEELTNKITDLSNEIDDLNLEYKCLTTNDSEVIKTYELDEYKNLYLCNQKVEELEVRVSSATRTLEFIFKSKVLKEINNLIREKSLASIKKQIKMESNKKVIQLLNRDDILIDKIESSISIKNREGVSQGQSLAIAYAYLATLFEESNHRIPFVIDSPAGALDIEVRREVSSIIPPLYDQLVIFILSGEREGFINGIEKFADIQYMTIYKEKKEKDGTGAEIIYEDSREYFMTFQSEDKN